MMMYMQFSKQKNGTITVQPEMFADERGSFAQVFCSNELKEQGVSFTVVQVNRSVSVKKGTVRGLHLQNPPTPLQKMVQCVHGSIFDVAVDVRPESETYLQWFGVVLTPENQTMLYVPEGFAHGFQTLEENTIVEYFMSNFYSPKDEVGYRWNDPKFGIEWPLEVSAMSEKDKVWPLL